MKLSIALALLISSLTLNASDEQKGMKAYTKLCYECHGNPYRGAKMHTTFEWEEIYEESDDSVEVMKELHKEYADASKVLNSGYFTKKRSERIKNFLLKNAKDAGSVPGCNANYCGPTK
jgi:hypothetical protein